MVKKKKKEKKSITTGIAHINSSFNNTKVLISDVQGNAIAWSSSGSPAPENRTTLMLRDSGC